LFLGKLVYGPFLGIFCGGLDFFDPEIVPLILFVREVIIFMRAKHIIGDFERFFEGAKIFSIFRPTNFPERLPEECGVSICTVDEFPTPQTNTV
jgi:hypothetical protein